MRAQHPAKSIIFLRFRILQNDENIVSVPLLISCVHLAENETAIALMMMMMTIKTEHKRSHLQTSLNNIFKKKTLWLFSSC